MNKIKIYILTLALTLISLVSIQAQITILTNHTNSNGSEGCTFNFINPNANGVLIQGIQGAVYSGTGAVTYELWANPNPVNGSPGSISTATGWSMIATNAFTSSSTTLSPVITGLNYMVPAGDSIGLYLRCVGASLGYMTTTSGVVNTFANGGCILQTGNLISYGGTLTSLPNHPRGLYGGVTFIPATPCSGTPIPGVVSNSAPTACSGSAISLGLIGSTLGTGLSYKWYKSSSLSGPYTQFDSVMNTSDIITSTSYYFCKVNCGTSFAYSDTSMTTVPALFPGGTYTINSGAATGGTNFQTFNAAVSAISCGTAGPVVFNVVAGSGPYNEQVVLPKVNTNSATNTITFNGNGEELNFSATNTNFRSPLTINDGDYYVIDSLKVVALGTGTYGFGMVLTNNADNNTIKRCIINSPTTSTSTFYSGLVITGNPASATTVGSNCDSNIILNNTITGGYYGLTVMGMSTTVPVYGNKVIGNTVQDFYGYGIYNYSNANGLIYNNIVTRPTRPAVTTGYGMMIYYASNGTRVERNTIKDLFAAAPTVASATYGMYIYPAINTGSTITIANNIIEKASNPGIMYGLYVNGDNLSIIHNTINVGTTTTSASASASYGAYFTGTFTNSIFSNNIISMSQPTTCTGNKFGIYHATAGSTISGGKNWIYQDPVNSTYNFAGYYGANYATLAAYKTATGQQLGSLDIDPMFTSSTDYKPMNYAYDNYGSALGVTKDYNDSNRNMSAPDIGAIEFSAPPCTAPPVAGISTVSDTVICVSFPVSFGLSGNSYGAGQSYTWQFSTTATGTYSNISAPSLSPAATLPASATGYYRCKVKCGTDSSYSTPKYILTNPALAGGTYTINAGAPASATNFTSFTAAASALTCGITGPVVFNVVAGSGPYMEQASFVQIPGSSATNTITINGNGETINYASTSSSSIATIQLKGTDFMTIDNLVIKGSGATYQGGIILTSQANKNTIKNCLVQVDSVVTGSTIFGIALSGSLTSSTATGLSGDSNTIHNNTISGGYYGINVYGSNTTTLASGNVVSNNKLTNQFYYGIRSYYVTNHKLIGNDLSRKNRTNAGAYYGLYNYYANGGTITAHNKIHSLFDANITSTGFAYNIYNGYCTGTATNPNKLYNNEIFYALAGSAYGIYCYGGAFNHIYHNTVNLDNVLSTATSGTLYGLYYGLETNSPVMNNNINITTSGGQTKYGLYYTSLPTISNYNNVWFNSTDVNAKFGYNVSAAVANLAAWKTATGKDSNSVSINPGMLILDINGDLTPTDTSLDNLGTPVGVTHDAIAHIRSTTHPDIGSREFPVCALANISITSSDTSGLNIACMNSSLTLTAPPSMTSYHWLLNGAAITGATTATFIPSTTGTYTVILDSAGCITTQPIGTAVTINPLPSVDAGPNDSICKGANVTLSAIGATTYVWNNGVVNSVPFPVLTTKTYTVIGTDANGCKNTDSVTIVADPLPTALAGPDQAICVGSSVTLNGTSNGTISWDNGVTNGVAFTPTSTDTFIMSTVTPATGCTNQDTVIVKVDAPPTANVITATINGLLGFNFTSDASNNTTTYAWNFGDGTTATTASPTHTYTAAGLKTVTLVITNTCGKDTVYLDLPVGLNNVASQNGFTVYPNPAKGKVIIDNARGYQIQSVKMISTLGSVVMVDTKKISAKQEEISLQGVAPGIYTIVIETDKGLFNQTITVIN